MPGSATAAGSEQQPGSAWAHLRSPSWAVSIGLIAVLCGWIIGIRPIGDNSFFTHLATGRIIVDTGGVPSSDPYTFTAAGEPWVVQSWLASVLYASVEQLGGLTAVRVVSGLFTALLAALGWSLLKSTTGVVPRLAAVAVFLAVGAGLWAPRPLMIGLLCLAATLFAIEGRADPRWLVPVGWVWVNSHGSFPLGLVLIGVAGAGRWMDGDRPNVELRCLRWAVLGTVAGAVASPLGPRALAFPIELLARQDVLRHVIEWRAPTFDTLGQRAFVLQLVLAIVCVSRRPSYRSALIVAVFTAAALLGARNLVVASLVMLPVIGSGLGSVGSISADARPRASRLLLVVVLAGLAVVSVGSLQDRDLELGRYPIDALAFLEDQQIDTREVRMAAPDIVGNAIEYVYGPERRVFYDDRFDMFPEEVSEAHLALVQAEPGLQDDLEELDVDLVMAKAGSPTGQVIQGDPGWRTLYLDHRWLLLCRRGAALTSSGRC